MQLWGIWYDLVKQLRDSCKRKRTFFWLTVVLIGFTIKFDFSGVTSLARGVGLSPAYYTCLLNFFHSSSVRLERLLSLWVNIVLTRFNTLVMINNRHLLVVDGIKVGKEGKKMPGVKWLHQSSDSNTKATYIMGHSLQAIAVLAKGASRYFAIPLTARIHEGIRLSCKDKRTLLDKLIELLLEVNFAGSYYLAADKYYCSGRLMKSLVGHGIHLITMMKKNAVAYYPVGERKQGRGRPKMYGEKVKLFALFDSGLSFTKAILPYDTSVTIEYCSVQLLWRPLGEIVHFILVKHPTRGQAIVMSTDLTLSALDAITGYSLRFKIEVLFKQAVHQLGTFMYHFWLKAMCPRTRGKASGDHVLQFAPKDFKEKVQAKIRVYHLFIQLGLIAQGLLQYLSLYYYQEVWCNFRSWLRTIRNDTLPSEKVVALALRDTYPQFLIGNVISHSFKKFLLRRTAFSELPTCDFELQQAA